MRSWGTRFDPEEITDAARQVGFDSALLQQQHVDPLICLGAPQQDRAFDPVRSVCLVGPELDLRTDP